MVSPFASPGGIMEVETKKITEVEEIKEQEAPKYETKIVDIFKLLLGFNHHEYGAEKKSGRGARELGRADRQPRG